MKISIITVCKNAEKYIEKAIKSVTCQTYKNIEYIIVDANSSDRTKQIISQYTESVNKFISEPDSGVYSAMNKGVKLCSGDFVYFLNSDDYIADENVIQDVVDFVSNNHSCDFVYGNIDVRSSSGDYAYSVIPPEPEFLLDQMIWGWIYHQATFSRLELFSKIGFFDERYKLAADHHWYFRLIQHGASCCYYPRTISSYYGGGMTGDISNQKAALLEIFDVQNQVPIYQEKYWLNRRIVKLQEAILQIKTEVSLAESQLKQAQNNILAIKTSKFWKMRIRWFQFKRLVGLPGDE